MEINNKKIDKNSIVKEILAGKIFIYPTDTIYGLGCDATNEKAVEKIKEIKSREKDKPLSIIAPSLKWILENLETTKEEIEKFLPGPFTLLLKKKNPGFLRWISQTDMIGIRIPANKFTKELQKAKVPFVSTSVNLSGEPFALKIDELDPKIIDKVDYIIEADKNENLSGKPSTLIINSEPIKRK